MDVKAATIEELRAEFLRLAAVVVAAQNERRAVNAEIELRVAAALAQTRIRAMTQLERDALAEALAVEKAR